MIDVLAGIPLWVIFVPITMVAAYYKGRRLVLWAALAYLTGPVALVIVLVRATLPRKEYGWLLGLQNKVASKSIEKKFEDLGSPDDFLREVDKDEK